MKLILDCLKCNVSFFGSNSSVGVDLAAVDSAWFPTTSLDPTACLANKVRRGRVTIIPWNVLATGSRVDCLLFTVLIYYGQILTQGNNCVENRTRETGGVLLRLLSTIQREFHHCVIVIPTVVKSTFNFILHHMP